MKVLIIFLLTLVNTSTQNSLKEALDRAEAENKQVMLYFSGSDWCGACINLKKRVLDTEEFQELLHQKYVFLQIDFPQRGGKAEGGIPEKEREQLAEKYNPEGVFPKLIVLDTNQKVIQAINGYKGQTAHQFIGYFNK